ncbi:hypothetical protein AB0392_56150 [Nonomuraea angiospora]|uniref:hypothetical protein n=1 Tax=Nonomuraea angiospora TaxID=46172 RepID=UPI00344C6A94
MASPLIAGFVAMTATFLAYSLTARARHESVAGTFRFGQIVSASLVSLAHGTTTPRRPWASSRSR